MGKFRFRSSNVRNWNPRIIYSAILLLLSLTFPYDFVDPQIALAAPQDAPVLVVTAQCDSAANGTFVITNTGGNMTGPGTWTLDLNNAPIATNNFQLNAGASLSIHTSGLFGTLTLTASGGGSSTSAIASTFCNPPTLKVTAKCDSQGQGTFVITDIGADMIGQGTWTLTLNATAISSNKFQLNNGQSTTVNTSGLLGDLVLSASGGGSTGTVSASTICPAQTASPNAIWLPLIFR